MFTYAVVPIILLVVAALIWTWWTSRQDRDPASSVDSFTRALTAMQPGEAPTKGRKRAAARSESAPSNDEAPTEDAASED